MGIFSSLVVSFSVISSFSGLGLVHWLLLLLFGLTGTACGLLHDFLLLSQIAFGVLFILDNYKAFVCYFMSEGCSGIWVDFVGNYSSLIPEK